MNWPQIRLEQAKADILEAVAENQPVKDLTEYLPDSPVRAMDLVKLLKVDRKLEWTADGLCLAGQYTGEDA